MSSEKKHIERQLTELMESEREITCGAISRRTYFDLHEARFADILHLCKTHVPDPASRVLDIGRSELTSYLSRFYTDVSTLGLSSDEDDGGHREVSELPNIPHIAFDLLDTDDTSVWPDCGPFDLIVFSEVVEHLHAAPEFVFAFLNSLLSPQGVLLCTTPNAVDAGKRLRMITGRNPYERLRLYAANPGHIREYTQKELREITQRAGLICKAHAYRSWIQNKSQRRMRALAMALLRTFPPLRPFQLLILTRANADISQS